MFKCPECDQEVQSQEVFEHVRVHLAEKKLQFQLELHPEVPNELGDEEGG